MQRAPGRRRGTTLPELLIALALVGIVAAVALSSAARLADRFATRGAARELRAALHSARHLAVLRATRAAVVVDTGRAVLAVRVAAETAFVRDLRALYGVRLAASRDSLAYAADGLGWGAANARLVVRRGAWAETVTVSRLGRVR
jgi:prepilin-type N-terminal cleavage/methylation domain-containing protein